MKIVFLNTWNAKQEQAISEFITTNIKDTDVFCFQEAYDNARQIFRELLSDFVEYYDYAYAFNDERGDEDYAQAIYVRKELKVNGIQSLVDKKHIRGLGICVSIEYGGKELNIINYHGISVPKHKLDTPDRLKQSSDLLDGISNLSGDILLGGDFNFLPNTTSYNMIKRSGFDELVIGRKIKTTRNRLYWDNRAEKHMHSDYVFMKPILNVKNFNVPRLEISDHLPLIIELG